MGVYNNKCMEHLLSERWYVSLLPQYPHFIRQWGYYFNQILIFILLFLCIILLFSDAH